MGFRGQYKNKRDANEKEIVRAFEELGATVDRMDKPMDLLVGYLDVTHLVEVKQEAAKLNDKQRAFRDWWRGDLSVVRSTQDVRDCIEEWGIGAATEVPHK